MGIDERDDSLVNVGDSFFTFRRSEEDGLEIGLALGMGLDLVPQAMLNLEQKFETDSSNCESKSNSEVTFDCVWYRFNVLSLSFNSVDVDVDVEFGTEFGTELDDMFDPFALSSTELEGDVESDEGDGILDGSTFQGNSKWKFEFEIGFELEFNDERSDVLSVELLRCFAMYSNNNESRFLGRSGL